MESLHEIIRNGGTRTFRKLLVGPNKPDVNEKVEGMTPLHIAVCTRNMVIIEGLLSERADTNATDYHGNTALHMALLPGIHRNSDIVKILIKHGANLNAENNRGHTPLYVYLNTLRLQKEDKKSLILTNSQVFDLIHADDFKILRVLVHHKAQLSKENPIGPEICPIYCHEYEYLKYLPLHLAVVTDSVEIVKTLAAAGAPLNKEDTRGYFPLWYAIWNNNQYMLKVLIDAGCRVDNVDSMGINILHMAASCNEKILEVLFNSRPDREAVNKKDNEGCTPLHLSAGNPVVVKLLLRAGADVNVVNDKGETALHYATDRPDSHTVAKMLIDAGADVNVIAKSGLTPLHLALMKDDLQTIRLLVSKGADVDAKDNDMLAPIHYAVLCEHRENRFEKIKILLEKNPDLAALDNKGRNVMEILNRNGQVDAKVVELIFNHMCRVISLSTQKMDEKALNKDQTDAECQSSGQVKNLAT